MSCGRSNRTCDEAVNTLRRLEPEPLTTTTAALFAPGIFAKVQKLLPEFVSWVG